MLFYWPNFMEAIGFHFQFPILFIIIIYVLKVRSHIRELKRDIYFHILPHICNMQSVNYENHLQLFELNAFAICRCVGFDCCLVFGRFLAYVHAWADVYTVCICCNLPLVEYNIRISPFNHYAFRYHLVANIINTKTRH